MERIHSGISEKVYNQLKEFSNSINIKENKYIGADNDVLFFISPAQTTQTIYVTMYHSSDKNYGIKIRISDHIPNLKRVTESNVDLYIDFKQFNINKIIFFYNIYKGREKSLKMLSNLFLSQSENSINKDKTNIQKKSRKRKI